MSKKNLFLVLNPFQLICAIEARSEFADNANNILIILDREAKQHIAYRQISNLIDLNWHRVIRLNEPKNRGIWRNVLLFKNLIKIFLTFYFERVNIFVGDDRVSFFQKTIKLYGKSVVRLDDGIDAIYSLQNYKSGQPLPPQVGSLPHYYTIFSDNDTKYSIIKNDFNFLKNSVKKNHTHHFDTVIIGKALSERFPRILDFELELITKTLKHDSKAVYITHRHDSFGKIAKIAKLGCIILELNEPIEVYFIKERNIPNLFVSIGSTALYTLKTLFPKTVCLTIIPDWSLLPQIEKLAYEKRLVTLKNTGVKALTIGEL